MVSEKIFYVGIRYTGDVEWAYGDTSDDREVIIDRVFNADVENIIFEDDVDRDTSDHTFAVYDGNYSYMVFDMFSTKEEAELFIKKHRSQCSDIRLFEANEVGELIHTEEERIENEINDYFKEE